MRENGIRPREAGAELPGRRQRRGRRTNSCIAPPSFLSLCKSRPGISRPAAAHRTAERDRAARPPAGTALKAGDRDRSRPPRERPTPAWP